jgi:hypothetical protein
MGKHTEGILVLVEFFGPFFGFRIQDESGRLVPNFGVEA